MQHKVVSSDNEELILVDESDNETGYLSKAACHDGCGLLHRAFSVFVFNADGGLLLQQRGKDKRLRAPGNGLGRRLAQRVQNGQNKSSGLAGAGLGNAKEIAAIKKLR